MLDKIDNDPDFSKNIIFSDEATFHTSGHVNRHNVRIWAKQNPQEVVERVRGSPKVNVWCALASDRIIGPFFFAESTIKKENYLDMLENFAMPQILEVNEAVLFQQDGAPPHYAKTTRAYLDEVLPNRWIGRGAQEQWRVWPSRSPDLTPLDFYLWGYVKDWVYSEKIVDLTHLKTRITEAIATVTPAVIQSVWREFEYRLDLCRATNGGHIEMH